MISLSGSAPEDIYNKDANGFFKLHHQLGCFPKKYETIKRSFRSSLSAQHPSKESPNVAGKRAHCVSLNDWNLP